MKRVFGVLGTAAVIFLMVTFLLGSLGEKPVAQAYTIDALPAVDTGDNISTLQAPEWTRATREWTSAEMAAARPYPLPEKENRGEMTALSADLAAAQQALEPVTIAATAPDGVAISGDLSGLEDFVASSSVNGYGYPGPFTRYTDYNNYKKFFPTKAIGKLYFYQHGIPYVCSGASIGGYSIWTAGHCVHDGSNSSSGWSYNVVFVPSYQNGKKPNGVWTAGNLWVKSSWYAYEDASNDMGGAVLNRWKNKRISQRVGSLGFAYNFSPVQHWFAIGYPAAYPFDGSKQVICAASYAYSDSWSFPNDPPEAIGCDQTGGTSGGPWIMKYNGGNYLNGNMSYRYTGYTKELFSPWFDTHAYSLYYQLVNSLP